MYRQGDVGIFPIEAMPQDYEVHGTDIVAKGEATGHAHRLYGNGAKLFRRGEVLALQVTGNEVRLVHEEHGAIRIPAGTYRVRIQREWDGEWSRKVED